MDGVTYPPDEHDLTDPLAGREHPRQGLLDALDRCLSGYGGVALIIGEAGIGKTTLSDRLAAQARRAGALTVTGHCYDLTAGQPYGPWIEIQRELQSSMPDVASTALAPAGERLAGPGTQEELFARYSSALREIATSRPLVLILEDIHWADHASLELLRHLARQAAGSPLLAVATFRDDEPGAEDRLSGLLPDLVRESRATRFELRRLSRQDVEEFVEQECDVDESTRASITTYLHERAEGNPFFMVELLRDIGLAGVGDHQPASTGTTELHGLPVPTLVRQVIDNRVRQLSERTRELLNIAAVIGQDVPVDLWRSVAGVKEPELAAAIEEAISCHLLVEAGDGDRVRFVHGLIQETVYRGQVALRRRGLHREIASRLAGQHASSADAVAHHFDRGNDARAVEWLVRAARHAGEVYAAPDAIRYVTRAEELAGQFSIDLPAEAYRIRAIAHEMLGEIEQAKVDYTSQLHAARANGDRATECRALTDLGLLWAGHDYQRSGDHLQQALEIARDLDDLRVRAQCLNRVANWQANVGRFDSAIEMLDEALEIFESAGDMDGVADTLDLLGSTNYLAGNYSASVAYYDRAIRQSRELNDRARLASSLANQAINGGDVDVSFDAGLAASRSPGDWVGYAEEAVQITREIGWKSGESFALAMLGAAVSVRGDLGRGLASLEEAHEIAHRFNHQQWLIASSLILGSVWNELLDPSRSQLLLERGRGLAEGLGSHLWSRLIDAALATFHAEHGDPDAGLVLLRRWSTGTSDEPARSHAQRALRFASGRVSLAAGEPAAALEIADGLVALEEGPSEPGGIPQVLKLKADVLAAMDRPDEADEAYAAAARAAELLEYRVVHWRVLRDWGRLAARCGQSAQAAELRRAAVSITEEIAKRIPDPMIRDRFQRRALDQIDSGDGLTEVRNRDTAGMSQREIEVLALVAEGLTDAQVGERLFISPRTVARHLQSVYSKIGVNSRAGATAYAYRHELIP